MDARRENRVPMSVPPAKIHPLLRCLLYVVCWPVAVLVLFQLVAPFYGPLDQSHYQTVFIACDSAAAVGLALFFRRFIDREPLRDLGFTFQAQWSRSLGIGVALGIFMQTVVLIVESTLGFAHAVLRAQPVAELESAAGVIPLLLLGAIAEEVPIRGYLFQNVREVWGAWPALVATSLVFAALHLFNPGAHHDLAMTMLGIASAGALFGLSVILTGSLWLAIGCHFAWNVFEGPIFGFPVSGLSFGSANVVTQTVTGPEWFTGGAFGPEAGASSLIALAAGAAVLYALYRRGVLTPRG